MTRVRIFACAGAGLALAALGWCLRDAHGDLASMSSALLSRSAGLVLFGIAMLAVGLVFRAAMIAPKAPVQAPRATSEFRRGFGDRIARAKTPLRQPTQREVIVQLRRAVAAQESKPQPASASTTTLPPEEIARLQNLLNARVARPRSRSAEQAKRRFLRTGVDGHGTAEN
jgi:hypothetical protein